MRYHRLFFSLLMMHCCVITSHAFARVAGSQRVTTAVRNVEQIVAQFPEKEAQIKQYEKEKVAVLLGSSQTLMNKAKEQLLKALSEVERRLFYWQYQKDHPWDYFVSKNPLKWVAGPAQSIEIEANLNTLKTHQGHLYTILGQIVECQVTFNRDYKSILLKDNDAALEWMGTLLQALSPLAPEEKGVSSQDLFLEIAHQLKVKLLKVDNFADTLLADVGDTAIPSYVVRNWLKGSALLLGVGYGYKHWYNNIVASFGYAKDAFDVVAHPVKETVEEVFAASRVNRGQAGVLAGMQNTAVNLMKKFVYNNRVRYGLSEASANEIIADLNLNNYEKYQNFLDLIASRDQLSTEDQSAWKIQQLYEAVRSGVMQISGLGNFAQGKIYLFEAIIPGFIAEQEKQYAAVAKFVLLTPAVLTGLLSYIGYQKLTKKEYSSIRLALVDLNRLFVDPRKELDDEQRGKMIYLIDNLKKRAQRELPAKGNVQASFIEDLEAVESAEYNVAAKRAIVEDMFKKYDFLGIIQQK